MDQNKQINIKDYWLYESNFLLTEMSTSDLIDKFNIDVTIFEDNLIDYLMEKINLNNFPNVRCDVSVYIEDAHSLQVSGDLKISIFIDNTFFTDMTKDFLLIKNEELGYNKIKVLIKEVNNPAKIEIIDNTREALANIINGTLEACPFPDIERVYIFCDDEGKLKDLPRNISIPENRDYIAGNFVCVATQNNEDLCSLSESQIKQILHYISKNSF